MLIQIECDYCGAVMGFCEPNNETNEVSLPTGHGLYCLDCGELIDSAEKNRRFKRIDQEEREFKNAGKD